MRYRSILTIATDPHLVRQTLATASAFTQREDAHLDVLALGVDASQLGYYALSGSEAVIEMTHEQAQEDAGAVAEAVRSALAAEPDTLRVEVENGIAQLGSLVALVAGHARFADLVILPQPYGTGRLRQNEAVVEAALFEGQAPVLVLPEMPVDGSGIGQRVLVAWNQSREAMVAVRRALPVLIRADRVEIVVIDPPAYGPERDDPGAALCRMLVRHGVRAEVTVLAKSMPKVSDQLARHALESGADLIVMGAYGHSRLRQAILGGATRNMLEQAAVPVLMAH